MNITDAVKYKLQGKHMDCTKCKYFATMVLEDRDVNLCAYHNKIKEDREMCLGFFRNRDTALKIRYRFLEGSVLVHSNAAMSPVDVKLLFKRHYHSCQSG